MSNAENESYWRDYPREAQIRFAAYAPTSAQPIISKKILEERRLKIAAEYSGKELPINSLYCGFRIKPLRFIFYAYRTDELSDMIEYSFRDTLWYKQLLSP